jgi:hypothetical protein
MKTLVAILMAVSPLAFAGEGIYWVPVDRPELSRYSVFDLDTVTVNRSNGRVSIQYALPEALTGEVNYLVFEGPEPAPGAPLEMTGAHGTVTCPSSSNFSMCETRYQNLNIDVEKRSQFLRDISRSELEKELREAVAQSFCVGARVRAFSASAASGGEPCGFLRVRHGY